MGSLGLCDLGSMAWARSVSYPTAQAELTCRCLTRQAGGSYSLGLSLVLRVNGIVLGVRWAVEEMAMLSTSSRPKKQELSTARVLPFTSGPYNNLRLAPTVQGRRKGSQ